MGKSYPKLLDITNKALAYKIKCYIFVKVPDTNSAQIIESLIQRAEKVLIEVNQP